MTSRAIRFIITNNRRWKSRKSIRNVKPQQTTDQDRLALKNLSGKKISKQLSKQPSTVQKKDKDI